MKVGDCVNLRTGGCLMTVRMVAVEIVVCDWFDENQTLHQKAFRIANLVRWVQA